LIDIEALRLSALEMENPLKNLFLVIVSNLLREYSFQEPSDLRIRRRTSTFPSINILTKINASIDSFAKNIKEFQTAFIPLKSNMKSEQNYWTENFLYNNYNLPEEIYLFCSLLKSKLKKNEGFRKRALPTLLYRYFYEMQSAFRQVYRLLKKDKYFCLIVGHN